MEAAARQRRRSSVAPAAGPRSARHGSGCAAAVGDATLAAGLGDATTRGAWPTALGGSACAMERTAWRAAWRAAWCASSAAAPCRRSFNLRPRRRRLKQRRNTGRGGKRRSAAATRGPARPACCVAWCSARFPALGCPTDGSLGRTTAARLGCAATPWHARPCSLWWRGGSRAGSWREGAWPRAAGQGQGQGSQASPW